MRAENAESRGYKSSKCEIVRAKAFRSSNVYWETSGRQVDKWETNHAGRESLWVLWSACFLDSLPACLPHVSGSSHRAWLPLVSQPCSGFSAQAYLPLVPIVPLHSGFSARNCRLVSQYTLDALSALVRMFSHWFQACLHLSPLRPGCSECFGLVSTCLPFWTLWVFWSAWFRICLPAVSGFSASMISGLSPTCCCPHDFALVSHSCLPLHSGFSARMISGIIFVFRDSETFFYDQWRMRHLQTQKSAFWILDCMAFWHTGQRVSSLLRDASIVLLRETSQISYDLEGAVPYDVVSLLWGNWEPVQIFAHSFSILWGCSQYNIQAVNNMSRFSQEQIVALELEPEYRGKLGCLHFDALTAFIVCLHECDSWREGLKMTSSENSFDWPMLCLHTVGVGESRSGLFCAGFTCFKSQATPYTLCMYTIFPWSVFPSSPKGLGRVGASLHRPWAQTATTNTQPEDQ